jgi:hypothetical protein
MGDHDKELSGKHDREDDGKTHDLWREESR